MTGQTDADLIRMITAAVPTNVYISPGGNLFRLQADGSSLRLTTHDLDFLAHAIIRVRDVAAARTQEPA